MGELGPGALPGDLPHWYLFGLAMPGMDIGPRAVPTAGLGRDLPPSHPQGACVAVTAVMHLLFLVAFSWMLVEGLLLWSKVVAVRMRPGPRMRLYYATGWGEAPLLPAPALPCLTSAVVQHHLIPISTRRPAPIPATSSVSSALSPSSCPQPQPLLNRPALPPLPPPTGSAVTPIHGLLTPVPVTALRPH